MYDEKLLWLTARGAMASPASRQEELRNYKVIEEFVAYASEGLTPTWIEPETAVFADPEEWAGWKWNGRESLAFFGRRQQFYVDRKTYLRCTQIATE